MDRLDYLAKIENNEQALLNFWQASEDFRMSSLRRLCDLIAPGRSFKEFMDVTMKVYAPEPNGSIVSKMDIAKGSSTYSVDVSIKDILGYANGKVYIKTPKEFDPDPAVAAKEAIKKQLVHREDIGKKMTAKDAADWMYRKAPDGREHLLCIDWQGRVLFDGTSFTSGEIMIPGGVKNLLKGGIVIHTHPEESSLSPADILVAIQYNLRKMIATGVKDNNLVAYIIQRTGPTWGKGTYQTTKAWLDRVEEEGLPQNGLPPHYKMPDKRHIVNKIMADELGLMYSAKILGHYTVKGGPGSGYFGHAGRPGKRGGSSSMNELEEIVANNKYLVLGSSFDELRKRGASIPRKTGLSIFMFNDGTLLSSYGGQLIHPDMVRLIRDDNPDLNLDDPDPVNPFAAVDKMVREGKALRIVLGADNTLYVDIDKFSQSRFELMQDSLAQKKFGNVNHVILVSLERKGSVSASVSEFMASSGISIRDGKATLKEATYKGGPGSGYFGHAGRPGERGGSASSASAGKKNSVESLGHGVFVADTYADMPKEYNPHLGMAYIILPDGRVVGSENETVHADLILMVLGRKPALLNATKDETDKIFSTVDPSGYMDTSKVYGMCYDLLFKKGGIRVREASRRGEVDIETRNLDTATLKKIQSFANNGAFTDDILRSASWSSETGDWLSKISLIEILDARRVVVNNGEGTLKEAQEGDLVAHKGGPGSGFFGHAGRPGKRGGSASGEVIRIGLEDRPKLKEPTMKLLTAIKDAGGTPYIVGGFARDLLMGYPPKDVDVEVYGLTADKLKEVLRSHGKVDEVGAAFGILKVDMRSENGDELDISMPRRENKAGAGHRGFDVVLDPTLTPKEAAARRDFTMNSMFYDPFTGEIHDPFNGKQDIENKVIRHTSDAYREDPLRVLRGVQFAARFGMKIDPDTAEISREMMSEYDTLAKERIYGEWKKFATKGKYPSAGLEVLRQTGWIEKYPELKDLIKTPQEPAYHPEGSVWEHTKQVTDQAVKIAKREGLDEEDTMALFFSALGHDMAKPITTAVINGKITSHGHEQAGVEIAKSFFGRIGLDKEAVNVYNKALPLIGNHLAHLQTDSLRTVRRLAKRLEPANIKQLVNLIEADHSGRGSLPKGVPSEAKKMLKLAEEANTTSGAAQPILMGRHLVGRMKPGPEMGNILRRAYEAQMDGEFSDVESGLKWLDANKEMRDSIKESVIETVKGGKGSGFFGHGGRPGAVGGSSPNINVSGVAIPKEAPKDRDVSRSSKFETQGQVDLRDKVYGIRSNGETIEVTPGSMARIEKYASRLPKGAIDLVDDIAVCATDKDFEEIYTKELQYRQQKGYAAESVYAFHHVDQKDGRTKIYFRPRGLMDESNFFHEVGHAVLDASPKKGKWYISYRDPSFDRFTAYSRFGGASEGFCETFAMLVAKGGNVAVKGRIFGAKEYGAEDVQKAYNSVMSVVDYMPTGKGLEKYQAKKASKIKKKEAVEVGTEEQTFQIVTQKDRIMRQIIVNIPDEPTPVINVTLPAFNFPEQKAPIVNVAPPEVNVAAPVVNVAPPEVTVNVPETVVNVAPAQVTVNVPEQKAPVIKLPAMSPVIRIPKQERPVVNVNIPETKITLPAMNPVINLPETRIENVVNVPEIKVPEIKMPEVKVDTQVLNLQEEEKQEIKSPENYVVRRDALGRIVGVTKE